MATITGTCSLNPTRYTYYITWSESNVNTTNNTSLVTATLYIAKVSTYRAEGSNNPNTMYIDGTPVSSNIYIDLNPASSSTMVTVTILSGSKTITHDPNGAKSITISASGTLPYGNGYGPQSGSLSGTTSLSSDSYYLVQNVVQYIMKEYTKVIICVLVLVALYFCRNYLAYLLILIALGIIR